MGLGHVMVHADKVFVFYVFDEESVRGIDFLRIQSGKRSAAATDLRIANGVQNVAANGADIKLGTQHICGYVSIGYGSAQIHKIPRPFYTEYTAKFGAVQPVFCGRELLFSLR